MERRGNSQGPLNHNGRANRGDKRLLQGPQKGWEDILRAFQIGMEFYRGFRKLRHLGDCVTVFGSARFEESHPYYQQAREVGRLLGGAGFSVMTGGGPGVMEATNRGAKEVGGYSVGCNIKLPKEQRPNAHLDLWTEFEHFYVRKVMLVKYSKAFVVLPGGFGTFDEVFETLTLIQTGMISRFPIVAIGSEYWQNLMDMVSDTMVDTGTIDKADMESVYVTDSPREAVDIILSYVDRRAES
ncbi:MAG: TIGR00730 family Rossman fold protein [Cellvibrionaceae bacterium]